MSGESFSRWEQVVLMLGKNNKDNESRVHRELYFRCNKGYALFESLIGLILLSIVSLSLVVALPILLEKHAQLDREQAILHRLVELHERGGGNNIVVAEPFRFEAFRRGDQWCATYRRNGNERIICL